MKTGTSRLMDSHLVEFTNPNANNIKSGLTTTSQQEISDDEIEKASQQTYPIKGGGNLPTRLDLDQYNKQIGFVSGIMWYRKKLGEQLKNIL